MTADRWCLVDKGTHFIVMCERERSHIQIHFGDTIHNIPLYGTRDAAKSDGEFIVGAFNKRDARCLIPRT